MGRKTNGQPPFRQNMTQMGWHAVKSIHQSEILISKRERAFFTYLALKTISTYIILCPVEALFAIRRKLEFYILVNMN